MAPAPHRVIGADGAEGFVRAHQIDGAIEDWSLVLAADLTRSIERTGVVEGERDAAHAGGAVRGRPAIACGRSHARGLAEIAPAADPAFAGHLADAVPG